VSLAAEVLKFAGIAADEPKPKLFLAGQLAIRNDERFNYI
jgi:hypothetical protein